MQFAKTGTDWRIVKPVAARADFAAVEGALERLSSAQMQEIVAPEAADLKQYGLDHAGGDASTVGTGSSRATLLARQQTENAVPFAKDASRPMVFTVGADADHRRRPRPVGEFRRKDLFDFRSFTANRVELRRGSRDHATFEKTKSTDGKDVWRDGAGKDVDTAKVEDLLTKLTEPPRAVVRDHGARRRSRRRR